MKLCYIIHPYRATTPAAIRLNIEAARCAGLAAARRGYYPVIPQCNTAEFDLLDPDIPNELWMDGTLELLHRCDCALLAGDHRRSAGCRNELKEAGSIPLYTLDNLPDLGRLEK